MGCGDNIPVAVEDAGPPDAAGEQALCGDGRVMGDEQCDDANDSNDDECLNDCTLACGDGVVNAVEICDTGIPAGMPGACPGSCDDSDACTTDVLANTGCLAECIYTDITGNLDGDGCCPDGSNANLDNDCMPVCGNGAVEDGEACDTAITAGDPGGCPVRADCEDLAACTADILQEAGTCQATCTNADITMPMNGDGCCPVGANIGNDNDCSPACGDGVLSAGETCDTAILAGMPDACPTAADCMDADACTLDILTGDGTCTAACTNQPITQPDDMVSDGCCPPTGTANNDLDCNPMCGNLIVEAGESCDDGNTINGDGCSATCTVEPVAFRIDSLSLRDPHPYFPLIGCTDINELAGLGLNPQLEDAITTDGNSDGLLDLNVVNVFRPLDQTASTTPMDIVFADCTAPMASTSCSQPSSPAPIMATATNLATGTCLEPIPGTARPYSPGITPATGPCYSSDQQDLTIDLGGIIVPLSDAQIGATYLGSPASGLVNGLLMGFISETDAESIIIPMDITLVGGETLASLLPGGMGNCESGDDTDLGPDGVTSGWWMYLNFTGTVIPWTSP